MLRPLRDVLLLEECFEECLCIGKKEVDILDDSRSVNCRRGEFNNRQQLERRENHELAAWEGWRWVFPGARCRGRKAERTLRVDIMTYHLEIDLDDGRISIPWARWVFIYSQDIQWVLINSSSRSARKKEKGFIFVRVLLWNKLILTFYKMGVISMKWGFIFLTGRFSWPFDIY